MHQGARAALHTHSLLPVVIGSSLLWSWGFICFLSPVMFPSGDTPAQSVGLELGFFASQISVVVFVSLFLATARAMRITVPRAAFLIAAVIVALTSLGIAASVRANFLPGIIGCSIADGICVTLLGTAWGTRYSLGSKRMRSLVILSFLVAYLIYLIVPHLPRPIPLLCACAFPLLSWALWRRDAVARHETAPEVFPSKTPFGEAPSLGEILAGSWEASGLPWKSLGAMLAAAFIGNFISSLVMGQTYGSADSFYRGGILVCACIATMTLVPLTSSKEALPVESVYRVALTFCVVGLVGILVFDEAGLPVGGALVQGCAYFLQTLIYLVVTQNTQEKGLSPLFSFGIGQATVSFIVVAGNLAGKLMLPTGSQSPFTFDVVCGLGIVLLFFMTALRVDSGSKSEEAGGKESRAVCVRSVEHLCNPEKTDAEAPSRTATAGNGASSVNRERMSLFVEAFNLTRREAEVFDYLSKGRSLPYIADELFVTTGTVKTHTTHIYRKLGVNSKQELLDLYETWEPGQ